VAEAAHATWASVLGTIEVLGALVRGECAMTGPVTMSAAQVEGGSPEDFVKLRTAAYHSMTAPSRFDEDVSCRRGALRVAEARCRAGFLPRL
jgi:hypothetical protein